MNWFNLSFVGWLIVIIALALVAYKFDVQPFWIGIGESDAAAWPATAGWAAPHRMMKTRRSREGSTRRPKLIKFFPFARRPALEYAPLTS